MQTPPYTLPDFTTPVFARGRLQEMKVVEIQVTEVQGTTFEHLAHRNQVRVSFVLIAARDTQRIEIPLDRENATQEAINAWLQTDQPRRPIQFKLYRFNPLRVARGLEGAQVRVFYSDGSQTFLWISRQNTELCMKQWSEVSEGLNAVLKAYDDNVQYFC